MILDDDDKVAVHWTCNGTHDGEVMALAPTGKKFSFSGNVNVASNWCTIRRFDSRNLSLSSNL